MWFSAAPIFAIGSDALDCAATVEVSSSADYIGSPKANKKTSDRIRFMVAILGAATVRTRRGKSCQLQ